MSTVTDRDREVTSQLWKDSPIFEWMEQTLVAYREEIEGRCWEAFETIKATYKDDLARRDAEIARLDAEVERLKEGR